MVSLQSSIAPSMQKIPLAVLLLLLLLPAIAVADQQDSLYWQVRAVALHPEAAIVSQQQFETVSFRRDEGELRDEGLTNLGVNLYQEKRELESFTVRTGISELSSDASAGIELSFTW